jgi:phage N-6-adenine-methyltransferase
MSIIDSLQISRDSPEWETPQEVFDALDREFHFTLDVAATAENAKCGRYFDAETDGLSQDWSGETCWMNPPYGRPIPGWVKKAHESSLDGKTIVVGLLPNRTDTRWWADHVMAATEVRLVKGRLAFGGSRQTAPFGSVIAVWGTEKAPRFSQVAFGGGARWQRRRRSFSDPTPWPWRSGTSSATSG